MYKHIHTHATHVKSHPKASEVDIIAFLSQGVLTVVNSQYCPMFVLAVVNIHPAAITVTVTRAPALSSITMITPPKEGVIIVCKPVRLQPLSKMRPS